MSDFEKEKPLLVTSIFRYAVFLPEQLFHIKMLQADGRELGC